MGEQTTQDKLVALRDRVFAGDNTACFIERERVMTQLADEAKGTDNEQRYGFVFAALLDRLSTPIEPEDVFLGRMLEAPWPDGTDRPALPAGFHSEGHMTLDWEPLLSRGLSSIAVEARATARRLSDAQSAVFADNAEQCCAAVARFARRYAQAARKAGQHRAAEALERVPHGPATGLFDALQSIWLVHLVTSCCIGSRDFAFGRMDQYLLPYYQRDLDAGVLDRSAATHLLAHFLLKANEITGTGTWNHKAKPTPSQASKQYLVLGGRGADGSDQWNALSDAILEAAEQVRMPQPVILARMDPDTAPAIRERVARACIALSGQMSIANDAVIVPALQRGGIPGDAASDYAMVGCHRLDLPGCMDSARMTTYHYHDAAHWLVSALHGGRHPLTEEPWVEAVPAPEALRSCDDVWAAFRRVCRHDVQGAVRSARERVQPCPFRFESLLIRDCVARGREACSGGAQFVPQGHFVGGIATVANGVEAIRRLVFEEGRFTLEEFVRIAEEDFAGREALRQEIATRLPKYGNDIPDVDALACEAGTIALDAIEDAVARERVPAFTGFYSLDQHHRWGHDLPGTPDGRRRGEPVSENQSPAYGTDTHGITALLNSVAHLPLSRTSMGTLNVRFAGPVPAERLSALVETYFRMGGQCIGFSFISRLTLREAQRHPDRHRSLCVRLYGYSEYFTALSPAEQEELIQRTEHQP